MKLLLIILLFITQSLGKIITVAPVGSIETADYTCDGTNDEVQIQLALCELKGYSSLSSDCGQSTSDPDSVSDTVKAMGGTVELLAGTFYVYENVRVYSNQILKGQGMDITTIQIHDDAPEFPNSGVIRMAYTTNTIIQDFTIDGNKDSEVFDSSSPTSNYRYGIYTVFSSRVHMKRVRAYNCPGYGFDPHGVPGDTDSTDYMIIEECYSEDNNLDGFTIDKSYYVKLINNWAINNHRHGFELTTGAVAVHITGNHAIGNGVVYATGGCGIKIQDQFNNGAYWGTKQATVSNNFITGSGLDGICVVEASQMLITGNIITDNGDTCIRLRDTSYDSVDSEQGSDDTIVSNNMCINNLRGIVVEDSHRTILTGNRVSLVTEYSDYGIHLKRSTLSVIHSNNLYGTNGVGEADESTDNDIVETLQDVAGQTPAPTPTPTSAPTVPGQTSSPTQSPTPAPTTDLSGYGNIVVLENENIFYETDDDRIFDTWKSGNNDFVNIDISSLVDSGTNKLYDGLQMKLTIVLDDVEYYPDRFEYTSDNTNNNHGIIFTTDTPTGGWVLGENTIYHTISVNDYYGSPTWTNMNRLQLYWTDSADWVISGNKQITVDIWVGDFSTSSPTSSPTLSPTVTP